MNNEVKTNTDKILTTITDLVISNIKLILVFVAGVILGIFISSKNTISNVGCIISCNYAPITYPITIKNPVKKPERKTEESEVKARREDLEITTLDLD